MQYMKYTPVVFALLLTGSVMAQQEKATCDMVALLKPETANSEVKVPSEEEIKAFVTDYKDSAESTTNEMFSARFCVPKLTPENKQKY